MLIKTVGLKGASGKVYSFHACALELALNVLPVLVRGVLGPLATSVVLLRSAALVVKTLRLLYVPMGPWRETVVSVAVPPAVAPPIHVIRA